MSQRSAAEIRRELDNCEQGAAEDRGNHFDFDTRNYVFSHMRTDWAWKLSLLKAELAEAERREGEEERILGLVDKWHDGDGEGQELHEYLGMTWPEYGAWVEQRASYIGKPEAERRESGQ